VVAGWCLGIAWSSLAVAWLGRGMAENAPRSSRAGQRSSVAWIVAPEPALAMGAALQPVRLAEHRNCTAWPSGFVYRGHEPMVVASISATLILDPSCSLRAIFWPPSSCCSSRASLLPGYALYQEKKQPEGVEISVGKNGLSIKEK
jgi:hypothetical protein